MKKIYLSFYLLLLLSSVSYSQNFWQPTNGPFRGASVNDFLAYKDSTIIIGTNEGIVKSTDNGSNWYNVYDQNSRIYCLEVDSIGTIYAGTKDRNDNPRFLRSLDDGENWIAINTNFWADVRDILILYKDTILVCSWDKGVYRSFDYGETWDQVNNGISYMSLYEIVLLSNGEVLVGSSGGGIYKSSNWGDDWFESNNGIPANSSGYRYSNSLFEESDGKILTGTNMGIYYTTNYGNNWIYRGTGIIYDSPAQCFEKDYQGVLYAGIGVNHGVYYSTNSGLEWHHLGLEQSINTIGWDTNLNLYVGSSGGGLYSYSTPDSTWIQKYNRGYTPIEIVEVVLTESKNLIARGKWNGLYYSTDNGANWKKLNFSGYTIYPVIALNDSIIIQSSSGIHVSNDSGKTWTKTSDLEAVSIYYDTTNQKLYIGTSNHYNNSFGIYKSTDFGQTWEVLHLFPLLGEVSWVNTLYVSESNNYIFANVFHGDRFGQVTKFVRSVDNGSTWEIIYEDHYSVVSSIFEIKSDAIYASSGNKLIISHDEGENWVFRDITNIDCISPTRQGRIFSARGRNISYTVDEGLTWFNVDNSGLDTYSVNDITINSDNIIYLATRNGIFIGDANKIITGIKNETNNFVENFSLSQNYPNPFNPNTKISWQSPIGSHQTLKVYDVLGNEVVTLVNEYKPAGSYEVEFSVEAIQRIALTSGVYFYQLKAGNYIETKKMVVLK